MRSFSFLLLTIYLVIQTGSLRAQAGQPDTIDTGVRQFSLTDSVLFAGAGLPQGVTLQTKALVYLPVFYRGAQFRNRVARGQVVTAEDSTCIVKIDAFTAPVRPGYRILLYGLTPRVAEPVPLAVKEETGKTVPFYKRRWFLLAGGAVATAAVVAIITRKSGSNNGKVVITGRLP